MSSKAGMEFGLKYQEDYGSVIETWGKRLSRVSDVTANMKKDWGNDLQKSFGDQLVKEVYKSSSEWKKVGPLPSKTTLENFAKLAVKNSLSKDMNDLLIRLHIMAQEPDSITAANTVSETIKRAAQTLAQIFDMVKDKFSEVMSNYFKDQGTLTGRRRWRTTSQHSRHKDLNYQVKDIGEDFHYKGEDVYGPRPPGGSPANWSNCSCYMERELVGGDWTVI